MTLTEPTLLFLWPCALHVPQLRGGGHHHKLVPDSAQLLLQHRARRQRGSNTVEIKAILQHAAVSWMLESLDF